MGMQRIGAVAVAAIFGLGLGACGDDGDGEDAADDVEETTTTADDSGTDDVDLGDIDFAGECGDFIEAFAGAGAAVGTAFSGTGTADDLEQVAAYFEEIADNVPDEISADFEIFAAAYTEFAQALAQSDIDLTDPSGADPEQLAELQGVMEAFSSPEVEAASENISAYVEDNCGAG